MGITRFSAPTPNRVPNARFMIDEGTNPGGLVLFVDSDTSLMLVEIDNSKNTVPVYLKMWNQPNVMSLIQGTTPPDAQFMCPATSSMTYSFSSAGPSGYAVIFDQGLVYTILTVPGTSGTGNDTAEGLPEANPTIKIVAEDQ